MRPVPQIAIDNAKELEHLELRVYDDQQPHLTLTPETHIIGKLTAGYGHTRGITRAMIGTVVTEQMADDWLDDDLDQARLDLYAVCEIDAINALTDHQYAALLLFCLNLGEEPDWTIWKRINARDFDQVPVEMIRFVYEHRDGHAVKVEGLVNRRTAEIRIWSTNEPGSVPEPARSSITRDVATPPVPVDPTPLHKKPTVVATVGAAVAAAPSTISKISDTISPWAAHSSYVSHLIGWLALVGAILAVAAMGFLWLKNRRKTT